MVFKPQSFHEIPPQAEMDDPTDALLEADVADALGRAGMVDATRVSVTARNSTVTLNGFVASRSEIDAAGEVAGRIEGVAHVDNRLLVQTAPV